MKKYKFDSIILDNDHSNSLTSDLDIEYFKIDEAIFNMTKSKLKLIRKIYKETNKLKVKDIETIKNIYSTFLEPILFKNNKQIDRETFDTMNLVCDGKYLTFYIKFKYSYVTYELSCSQLDFENIKENK